MFTADIVLVNCTRGLFRDYYRSEKKELTIEFEELRVEWGSNGLIIRVMLRVIRHREALRRKAERMLT